MIISIGTEKALDKIQHPFFFIFFNILFKIKTVNKFV